MDGRVPIYPIANHGVDGDGRCSLGAVDSVLRGSMPVHLQERVLLPFDRQVAVPCCPVELDQEARIGQIHTTGLIHSFTRYFIDEGEGEEEETTDHEIVASVLHDGGASLVGGLQWA